MHAPPPPRSTAWGRGGRGGVASKSEEGRLSMDHKPALVVVVVVAIFKTTTRFLQQPSLTDPPAY